VTAATTTPATTPASAPTSTPARGERRAAFLRDAKELARPALVYQAWVVLMLAIFDLVLLVLEGFSGETFVILAVLSFATLVGVTLGQAMAIARLRGSFLGCLSTLWLTLSCLVTVPLGGLGPLGGILIALLWLTPIFVSGGVWSLASSRALFAAWVPVIYGTGAMFAIVEHDDRVAAWESGDKLAIWSVSTALILFLTIGLLLAYLVARERHRLHLWRHGPRALLAGSITEKGAARPRLTMLGWLTVAGVGIGLTAGTLLIAPYLFRTGPDDDGEGRRGQGEPQQGQGEPQQGQGEPQQGEQPSEGQGAGEQVERAAEAVAQAMCPLLIGLLLMAGGAAVLVRPLRRLVIIEYLRAAPFPVAPTTRIRMGWRLIEIGLGDLGIEGGPSMDASELVRRHERQLAAIDPQLLEDLREAARLRDRITYGLGIEPGDVLRFARDAERIFVIATNRVELQREAQNVFRDVR
jgi:hypothetical protein